MVLLIVLKLQLQEAHMFDWFVAIPGSVFIWLFILGASLCIFGAWIWLYLMDDSENYTLPPLNTLNPLLFAALRGGKDAVIHTAIFDLWRRGAIALQDDGRLVRVASGIGDGGEVYAAVEQALHDPHTPQDLILHSGLRSRVEHFMPGLYQELEALHLYHPQSFIQYKWQAFMVAFGAIMVVGGAKWLLGLSRGKPIGFLTIALIAAPILLGFVINPFSAGVSRLGKACLAKASSWLNNPKQEAFTAHYDQAWIMAIGGYAILQSYTPYAGYCKAMTPAMSSSGSSGGCSSSSCGGGSCGGGGCGGGCGGCGG